MVLIDFMYTNAWENIFLHTDQKIFIKPKFYFICAFQELLYKSLVRKESKGLTRIIQTGRSHLEYSNPMRMSFAIILMWLVKTKRKFQSNKINTFKSAHYVFCYWRHDIIRNETKRYNRTNWNNTTRSLTHIHSFGSENEDML